MLYNTVEEYDAALTRVRAAMDRQLDIGESGGTTVAGNARNFKEVPYDKLEAREARLLKEKRMLLGRKINPKAAW